MTIEGSVISGLGIRVPGKPRRVIVGLDGIRFAAASMVMATHLCTSSWASRSAVTFQITEGKAAFPELFSATWFGWVGVEIFFVISGLVIAFSAESANATSFLRSRILRLYPSAWVCATLTAVTILVLGSDTHSHTGLAWLSSITLFPMPPWIDPVYWTLGIELAFYGLILLMLSFRQFHRFELVTLVLGSISSAYYIFGTTFAPDFLAAHFEGRIIELSLVAHGCCFAVGALTYVIFRSRLSLFRAMAMTTFLTAVLLEVRLSSSMLNPGLPATAPQIAFLVATALIFVSMRWNVSMENRGARFVRVIGLATYPLYLMHQIVGAAIMRLVWLHSGSRFAALSVAIVCCIVGSVVIAIYLEPPLRSAIRTLLLLNWRKPNVPHHVL